MLVSSVPAGKFLAGDVMGCNGLAFLPNFMQSKFSAWWTLGEADGGTVIFGYQVGLPQCRPRN